MPRKLIKLFSFLLSLLLIFEQSGLAQVAGTLDISGHLAALHNSISLDKFRPLHLRYLSYDNIANSFKLLLDKGDFFNQKTEKLKNGKTVELPNSSTLKLEEATQELLNYFFVGLTLPNESFWVNLRPDAPDHIIDDELAKTDVGRILLEADLQLKKDTARYTSPAAPEGREYWDKLYKKAGELFGNVGNGRDRSLQIPTLTRPWIVPNEIIVRETETNAYIYKATLKVMLEEDYLVGNGRDRSLQPSQSNYQPLTSNYNFSDPRLKELNEYSTQLIRENIIPRLTYEVNTSKRYAPLRQVYYSLIMAQWFKSRFYGKGGLYPWLIDKKNLSDLTSKDPWSKTTYFKAYQKSFKDGEYNLREPIYTPFGQSIRSYVSGGINFGAEILKAVDNELVVSSSLRTRALFSKNTIGLEISGGSVNGPFGIEINIGAAVFALDLPPSRLPWTEEVSLLSQVSATPKEKNTETSSPLVRNEGPKKSFPFPFLRMAKRFVLSISTLGVIIYNLIDHSLDVFAEALPDGYELLLESKLWRFFKIRILLPLSISLNIKRGIRFRLDDDRQEIEAGNIEIRFGFNKLIFEKKDGRGYFLVDSADENNYLALRKNILSMLSSQIKKTKNIDLAVHFLYLEGGSNIQNFIELAQREGYAEFLGEILSLIKELKSFYGVEYVYPKAILKLFSEKEKILSQLKSIKEILPEFRYEMGVGKEIIYPIEYLVMNWRSKFHSMNDRQLISLIYTFNPKLLSWDIENAKTIFFRLSQPPSFLLCLFDGSLNKEIRESEGDLNKFVLGVLRKPALKVERDGSFKIEGVVPDLKLRGLKKDLVLAYCSHKAFRGVLPLSDLPARKVDNVLPLDFLAEIKKDDELLQTFMERLNSHPDECMENLQNILLIFNPSLLGNIQNIKVIFESFNKPVFLIKSIINGSLNEIIRESDNIDKFVKKALKAPYVRTALKKQILESCLANVSNLSSVLDEIKDNQELIKIFIDCINYQREVFLSNIEVILKAVNPFLLDKIEGVKRVFSFLKNPSYLIKPILDGSLDNVFEESENDVYEFIKLSLKSKIDKGIKVDILRSFSSIPNRELSFPGFYKNIKSLNLNPLPIVFSKLFPRIKKLEPKGRTERFSVPGDKNIFYFKHLTQDKGPDELMREICLLEAIQKGIVAIGDIDKNSFPVIVTSPESEKSLFDFNPDVPFAGLNKIENIGIIYTAPDDYFTYITEDNSRKLHNPEERLRTITGALENSLDLALSLWMQGIFLDVDIYHRKQRFKWLGQCIDNKAEKVGTIRISDILEWFKYPNISILGPRDFGHYQLWNEIKDAEDAISKIGNYLIYYTFIAAAAFRNNRLKKGTFKDFISRQYKKVGVNVYGGFADEMWQAAQNKPVFVRKLGTRGLFLKPQTLDAVFEFSISVFLSFLGKEENNALSAADVFSAIQKAQDPDTLCLTPDSLITLANGSQKPLIELKPSSHRIGVIGEEEGDMVLSLNEQTGRLEPHRVLALLDMGVKPVYRLTTASGKSLKTTLTHPYLTKDGWRKLSEIKAGEEVAAAGNKVSGAQRIKGGEMQRLSRKEKSRAGIRTDKHRIHFSQTKDRGKDNCVITTKMIFPDKLIGIKEYFPVGIYDRDVLAMQVKVEPANGLAKVLQGEFIFPEVLVEGRGEFRNGEAGDEDLVVRRRENPINNLCSFFPAIAFDEDAGIQKINHLFFFPQASYSFSQSSFNFAQPLAYLNQGRDFLGKQGFRDIFIPGDYRDTSASKPCKSNMLFRNRHYHHLSYYQNDYLSIQSLLAKIYHFLNVLSRLIFPSAFAQGEPSDILWDKIISIEPLGPMPVYDIEVEATHNFVAQGIVAHNTYSQGTGDGGQGAEEIASSAAELRKKFDDSPDGFLSFCEALIGVIANDRKGKLGTPDITWPIRELIAKLDLAEDYFSENSQRLINILGKLFALEHHIIYFVMNPASTSFPELIRKIAAKYPNNDYGPILEAMQFQIMKLREWEMEQENYAPISPDSLALENLLTKFSEELPHKRRKDGDKDKEIRSLLSKTKLSNTNLLAYLPLIRKPTPTEQKLIETLKQLEKLESEKSEYVEETEGINREIVYLKTKIKESEEYIKKEQEYLKGLEEKTAEPSQLYRPTPTGDYVRTTPEEEFRVSIASTQVNLGAAESYLKELREKLKSSENLLGKEQPINDDNIRKKRDELDKLKEKLRQEIILSSNQTRTVSSAVRISYEDLAQVPDTKSRAQEIIDKMKKEHGNPYETKMIDIKGKKIEAINWFRELGVKEWQVIQDLLGKFRSIAGGKFLEEIYYLAIEPSDRPNPNASGEKLNGWGAVDGVFKLFPNAFNQKEHRVSGVSNLSGTLIHELGHTVADTLVNTWREKFPENNNHIAYITSYAKTNAKEDIAETMIAAILGIDYSQQVIVQEKINFLQKILGINPEQPLCLTPDSLITLADGSQKPLIALKPFPNLRGSEGGADGDMVLSLNEVTGRLEPHRVLALLDMGVKPVYQITTASGKSLKTTLTHPYLTKQGWRKLQDIKVGDEITVVKEDLSSPVSVFSSINPVNHNVFASHIKTDTILSDSESMGGRRQVNQRPSEGQGVIRREVKFNLFEDASLELKGKFLKFSFTSGSELDFFNHQGFQISPNLCLILAKGTRPNLLASSIPFFSLNTNLGFIGRWASISSISQPTGLWNTYSLAETCSSSLASTAQSKSHNEYVSKIKYLGEPFLSTTTAALKSEDLRPAPLSSLGIEANFASASNLTVSFADNFIKDVDFMFSPPDNFKYNTLISGLSRLMFPSAFAQDEPSDILWDKIISIEPLLELTPQDTRRVSQGGDLEPHGVLALLDMGVKPVYQITTASGKSLKTTLTHPYLTMEGWKKLQDIRVGEEVATVYEESKNVLQNSLNLFYGKSRQISYLLTDKNLVYGNDFTYLDDRGFGEISLANFISTEKIFVFRDYLGDIRGNGYSDDIAVSCVKFTGRNDYRRPLFKSGKIRERKGNENDISLFKGYHRCCLQDYSRSQRNFPLSLREGYHQGISLAGGVNPEGVVFVPQAVIEKSAPQPFPGHSFALSFPSKLKYTIFSSLLSRLIFPSAFAQDEPSDILWDKIISIEPLGPMPVYDIEVEATHNFIAQGILAHNTYSQKIEAIKDARFSLEERKKAVWDLRWEGGYVDSLKEQLLKDLLLDEGLISELRVEALKALMSLGNIKTLRELIPTLKTFIQKPQYALELQREAIFVLGYLGEVGVLEEVISPLLVRLKALLKMQNLLNLSFSKDPKEIFKNVVGITGFKVYIMVTSLGAVRTAKGLIKTMQWDKEFVNIVYTNLTRLIVEKEFPGFQKEEYAGLYKSDREERYSRNNSLVIDFYDSEIYWSSFHNRFNVGYTPYKYKYELLSLSPKKIPEIKNQLGLENDGKRRKVITVGSFFDYSEVKNIISVYNSLYGTLPINKRPLLIMVPASRIADQSYLSKLQSKLELKEGQKVVVRNNPNEPFPNMDNGNILIVNTAGELPFLYEIADASYVGTDRNLAEPLSLGKPVLYNPDPERWQHNQSLKEELEKRGVILEFTLVNLKALMGSEELLKKKGEEGFQAIKDFVDKSIPDAAKKTANLMLPMLLLMAINKIMQETGPLCLTPDSLITLADGSQKPLIALKPLPNLRGSEGGAQGDMVLSLNEQTGRLEPHRVLALLDMGVKPVYRITTASGKQLKTTLTHPYLTKNGWRKLSEIKAGEEVSAVSEPANPSTVLFNHSQTSQKFFFRNRREKLMGKPDNFINREKINSKENDAAIRGNGISKDIPEISISGDENKRVSFDKFVNFFVSGLGVYISYVKNRVAIAFEKFSQSAWAVGINEEFHQGLNSGESNLFFVGKKSGVENAGFDIFGSNRAEFLLNSFDIHALSQSLEDNIYWGAGAFNTGFPMLNILRRGYTLFNNLHINHFIYPLSSFLEDTIFLYPSQGNLKVTFEPITRIEYLGSLPVYDIEVEATHNFIAQGIVAHNTYTNKQKTENREQRTEGSKMVDSPLQEKRKAGSLAIKNLKLLKEVLSSYQIIFNLHDTAQEFAPDLILNIWLEIDRHLQAGKIKIDLDAGSLKEFILLFKDEEMVEAVGKILANRVLNLLDRDLTKIKKEIKSKNYGNIPGIIKKLFDNPFVSIVEEAQHDFPKLFENFHNSKNTFMEMLRNRLAPLSSLADQLAKKLSVSEDMDENGKTMGELLNNYLQATKDLLRQLKFRLEEITVRRAEQLTPEEKQGLKFVEGELPYALLLRGKESRIIGRLNWSYAPDRNQIDNVSIRILQLEEQGEGYGMEPWRGAGLSGLLDGKRDGKVVVDGIAETLQAQGFWRKVLKYENESLPEEKCEIKIMIKDGESKREINLSQLQAGDIMIEFTITIPVSSSSLVKESANDLGGVDFIRLPIISQPEITSRSPIMASSPQISISRLNLDEEWAQIQKMVNAGIRPSSERLREYALASSSLKSEDYGREIDKLLGCIADILRLEEERVLPIEPTLREILVLLESDKPANELQSHLSKITVLPKEPKSFENF